MYDQLIERINRGIWQQIFAFFLLWFAVYGATWTIIEPLGFDLKYDIIQWWRFAYIGTTFSICIVVFFLIFFRKKLERFGFEEGDTDLNTTAKIFGSAKISTIDNGFHGQTYQIASQSLSDYIDWTIKASAHKAKLITFIYKPTPDLFFYVRVSVLSKNRQSSKLKWLRFETASSTYQSINDDEEMGIPVTATDDDGFLRVTVILHEVIATAFGRHGWRYDKILEIRSRLSGIIRSIELK